MNALDRQLLDEVETQLAATFEDKEHAPAGHHNSAPYYRLGDIQNGYYVLVDKGEFEYVVRYRTVRITETCQGQQIYVLRVGNSMASVMFARHVAFNLLLPQYHVLVSECQHTRTGNGFWGYSAEYAFEHNCHVYFWDKEAGILNKLASLDSDLSPPNLHQWRNFRAQQNQLWVISDNAVS